MKNRASEEILGSLHDAVAKDLLTRVLSGEATPAELNAAIKFLQNNSIEANITGADDPLAQLAAALPTFDDEMSEDGYVN